MTVGVDSLIFRFDDLPDSVNNLYLWRGGRRVMTTKGKNYRNRFVTRCGGLSPADLLNFVSDNEEVYRLDLWIYLPEDRLLNLKYGQSRSVKSPYKDVDASNFIKLAEDSIARLLGIRDRNNFSVLAHKRLAPGEDEFLVAQIKPLNLMEDPFPCPIPLEAPEARTR